MLTVIQLHNLIKQAQKEQRTINMAMEPNLAIRISPAGTATWFAKLKLQQHSYVKTLGQFPAVSPTEARREKDSWVQTLKTLPPDVRVSYTVAEAFADWGERKKKQARSFDYMWLRIKKHILPKFGHLQVKDLTAAALIRAWEPLELGGHIETCRKLCDYVKSMSAFVINTGRVETMHDLSKLKTNYPPKQAHHLAAMSPEQLPELFYELEHIPRVYGSVWQAMMCQFYTLSRPREVAEMRWEWVDFEHKVIHFPPEIMKTGRAHDVPITTQLETLLKQQPQTGEWVFTTPLSGEHINRESVRLLLHRTGLSGVQTAHGIRSIGATWLAEQGVREDVAEMCLAHSSDSMVRRAYQRSEFLEKRRPVMQSWCDYVDKCRAEAHARIRQEMQSKEHAKAK